MTTSLRHGLLRLLTLFSIREKKIPSPDCLFQSHYIKISLKSVIMTAVFFPFFFQKKKSFGNHKI